MPFRFRIKDLKRSGRRRCGSLPLPLHSLDPSKQRIYRSWPRHASDGVIVLSEIRDRPVRQPMFRSTYPAIRELFHAPHPAIPFFVASFLGLLLILLPAMLFRRTNKFPVKGRVNFLHPLNHD